jgi:hypothetical protein
MFRVREERQAAGIPETPIVPTPSSSSNPCRPASQATLMRFGLLEAPAPLTPVVYDSLTPLSDLSFSLKVFFNIQKQNLEGSLDVHE